MSSIANTLLVQTARNFGATVSLMTGELANHTTGFYVGGKVATVHLPLEPTLDEYELAVEKVTEAMGGVGYIGSWRNVHACQTDIDGVQHVPDVDTALRLAKERNEVAVWEIAGGTTLFV